MKVKVTLLLISALFMLALTACGSTRAHCDAYGATEIHANDVASK